MDLQFAYPQQPSSPFSFNYDPRILTAYSANPNANIQGGINPTGNQSLSFQNQSTSNTQNTSATDIVQPKIQSFTPQVGQSNSSGQQTSGNPSLNSNALSLVSTAAQHSGVGKSLLSGATNSINDFGGSLGFAAPSETLSNATLASFGVAPGASSAAEAAAADVTGGFAAGTSELGVGANASTGIFGSATLSGTLGAAGLGFLGGGILAHALGENSTGGSIGGAVGAAAGYALGGAGAAALGLELGAFAGPVGAIVGGIGGAIFGGMFGNNSKPTSADNYGAWLTPEGGITGGNGGSKNPGQYAGFGQNGVNALSSQLQAASSQLGIKFNPKINIDVSMSTEHGGANIYVDKQAIPFTAGNQQSQQDAFNQAITLAAQKSGYTDTASLNEFLKSVSVGSKAQLGMPAPSIPNAPTNQTPNSWQQFLTDYKAKQDANAAPAPTS